MTRPGPFELAIFDMDGVLVDTEPCHDRAFAELWRHLGVEGPVYKAIAGRSTREAISETTASLKPTKQQIETWIKLKQQWTLDYLQEVEVVFPDVRPMLDALARAGVRVALATAAAGERALLHVEEIGASRFSAVVTADDVTRAKPDPEVFTLAMQRAGAAPERCLVIEDALAGIQAGLAAGASVACVRSSHDVADPRYLGAFPDLGALGTFLGLPA